MTWSIVARGDDGTFGVAVASRAFAVGALCPYARSHVGAVSTQALVNPYFGPRTLELLASGMSAEDTVNTLVQSDRGQSQRQVHLIDRHGKVAAHTGSDCIGSCGHLSGPGYSVAGNMLANEGVLAASAAAFETRNSEPMPLRLINAMQAGQDEGGDRRGQQAAALLIYRDEEYPLLDLRVDDHATPITELRRLYEVSFERFQPFLRCLPSQARPEGILNREEIEAEVERFIRAR